MIKNLFDPIRCICESSSVGVQQHDVESVQQLLQSLERFTFWEMIRKKTLGTVVGT